MPFIDRADAGRQLADALAHCKSERPIVFGLARGGLPVAAEVATALDAPLELMLVRKVGVPFQPELAMGAIADGEPPLLVRNEDVVAEAGVSEAAFETVYRRECAEMARRRRLYLGGRRLLPVVGRTIVVVDDGVATGATMRAALRALRKGRPRRIVLAVPVAAADTLAMLHAEADEVVCLERHPDFGGVGQYYRRFEQLSDEDVLQILAAAGSR